MKLEQDTATKASTVAFQSSSPLAYWSWALLSLWVWCFGKFTILRWITRFGSCWPCIFQLLVRFFANLNLFVLVCGVPFSCALLASRNLIWHDLAKEIGFYYIFAHRNRIDKWSAICPASDEDRLEPEADVKVSLPWSCQNSTRRLHPRLRRSQGHWWQLLKRIGNHKSH